MLWFIALLLAVPCAIISALIASSKGRNGAGWFFLGLFFGPFAVLGIAIASKDYRVTEARAEQRAALREQYPQAEAGIRAAQIIGLVLIVVLLSQVLG